MNSLYVRYTVYSVCMLAVLLLLRELSHWSNFLAEVGPVEFIQEGLLLAIAAGFATWSWRYERLRLLMILFAFLSGAALIRELDFHLDRLNPFWGWKLPMAFLVLIMVLVLFKHRSELWNQVLECSDTRSMVWLWCGFLIVVMFSQLLGHGPLLEPLFGEDYHWRHKRYVEEMTELIGHMFLFVGMLETRYETVLDEQNNGA